MKNELRRRFKAVLAALPAEEVARKSGQACDRLVASPEYARARSVMIYLPLPGEADAGLVAAAAWRGGKTVLAPQVDWTTETMAPARIHSLEEEMVVGRHGVRSPQDGVIWPVGDIDLIVAPALAIDRQGNRLGRGGGFYDRFLSRPGVRACLCALVHHEQLLGELPHVAHDMPVDMAVTDQEVLRFARSPKAARAR